MFYCCCFVFCFCFLHAQTIGDEASSCCLVAMHHAFWSLWDDEIHGIPRGVVRYLLEALGTEVFWNSEMVTWADSGKGLPNLGQCPHPIKHFAISAKKSINNSH